MMTDAETRVWHAAIVTAVFFKEFFKEFILDFLRRIKSFTVVMKNGGHE